MFSQYVFPISNLSDHWALVLDTLSLCSTSISKVYGTIARMFPKETENICLEILHNG